MVLRLFGLKKKGNPPHEPGAPGHVPADPEPMAGQGQAPEQVGERSTTAPTGDESLAPVARAAVRRKGTPAKKKAAAKPKAGRRASKAARSKAKAAPKKGPARKSNQRTRASAKKR